jgi:predicted metallopeptidase
MAASRAPFDFSNAMYRLCDDITQRLPDLRHVRMPEVAVTFAQARRRVSHGIQAKLTPLRFEDGSLYTERYGRQWTVPRLYHGQQELLYILTFYLPRFFDHCFREKLITVIHELFHISPEFNGDIRRFGGRYHAHSHSQKEYDECMGDLVDVYLKKRPPRELYAFLEVPFTQLQAQHGGVVGLKVPIPKLIPLSKSA